jgi:hypothetical protein
MSIPELPPGTRHFPITAVAAPPEKTPHSPAQTGRRSSPAAPRWLADAFVARGGAAPTLLRDVAAAVWADGKFVAKLDDDPAQARREQRLAAQFSCAGCRVAEPLGAQESADTADAVSWWAWVDIDGPASPCEAVRWLRTAHDTAKTQGVPPARWLPSHRAVHPDAVELHYALAPWRRRAREVHARLVGLPDVVIHGDANPTNIVRSGGGVLALDFGAAGTGPRVADVATVAVLAVETGRSSWGEVIAAYGPHQDVTPALMQSAELVVAVARAQACTWVPWLEEGWDRLAALRASRPYVFSGGGHPK